MKPSSIAIFFVAFFCTVLTAHAEVYTWVDKEGKKHYGDHIPAEYVDKGKQVEEKPVNTVAPVKPISVAAPPNFSSPNTPRAYNQEPPAKESKSCSQQWADYQQAQSCFSKCAIKGGGINVAKCDRCTDLPRPNCEK